MEEVAAVTTANAEKIFGANIHTTYFCAPQKKWRRVRVVEGARLESVYTGNCIASSNLAVSAEYSNLSKPTN